MREPSSLLDLKSRLLSLSPTARAKTLLSLPQSVAEALLYDWVLWGRDSQQIPGGNWSTWLILAGRGFGKTRTGSETIKQWVLANEVERFALVAATAGDARDVMVEGESGLLAVFPPSMRPIYEPSKRRVTFHNGARATLYSADEPERLRGPQHGAAWADELGAWRYPEAWDQLQFGLRLGENPRVVVTTTPRPTPLVKDLYKDPSTFVTKGSTFDNKANLAKKFIEKVVAKYEGTRLGRQELEADILDDNPGALWQRTQIDLLRIKKGAEPDFRRIVVAVDPAVSNNPDSDETGIVVAALGADNHGYVLADGSMRGTPNEWAAAAVRLCRNFGADRLVAEVNNGGDLVEAVVRSVDGGVPYKAVRASRGKLTRAEPVAALYEQGKIHHVGAFGLLEDQMCDWDPSIATKSPDRMDALVWAFTELMIENNGTGVLDFYANQAGSSEKLNEAKKKLNEIFRLKPKA